MSPSSLPYVPPDALHQRPAGRQNLLATARRLEAPMRVWLWDAGTRIGVTDNENRAMLAARDALRDGETATVELALAALSFREPTAMYLRTGCGWTGRATEGGITWSPLVPE
jgi:hypothetical protein